MLLKLARPPQWLKNGIILLALIFAGELTNPAKVKLALAAIALFCLLSSAVYTFNDLVDREKDRRHPLKRERPLASGRVAPGTAVVMIVVLLIVGLAGAWFVNMKFFLSAVVFLGLNLLYTLWLKNIVILDAMAVALSFVVRAYAGAFAVEVPASKYPAAGLVSGVRKTPSRAGGAGGKRHRAP